MAAHCGSTATRPWPASMLSQAFADSFSFSDMYFVGMDPRRSRSRAKRRPSDFNHENLVIWLVNGATDLGKTIDFV